MNTYSANLFKSWKGLPFVGGFKLGKNGPTSVAGKVLPVLCRALLFFVGLKTKDELEDVDFLCGPKVDKFKSDDSRVVIMLEPLEPTVGSSWPVNV